jgi:hypothetical protein
MKDKHSHYYKDVRHLSEIDVYRVLQLFNVTDPCVQHAVKKLLCAGGRGAKDQERDLREAVDSVNRSLQMHAEDCNVGVLYPQHAPKKEDIVTLSVGVKVDPGVGLLMEAAKFIASVEDGSVHTYTDPRIPARALLYKIKNFAPMVLDRNEAAAAQGFDLVQAHQKRADDLQAVMRSMEVDSYQHIAAQQVPQTGVHNDGRFKDIASGAKNG